MAARLGLSLLALLFAGACFAQADYEIRLARPGKKGDRYRIEASGEQLRRVALRSGGQTIPGSSEGFKVELTGEATVLEADAKGNVTRAQVRVDTLVRVVGLQRDEMLGAGTLVTESRAGPRQRFQIDGRDVAPLVKDLLEVVLSETNDPEVPSDDELVGTRERKKVGESWQVNRESLARFVSRDRDISLDVKPGDVEGSGRLTALEKVDGTECQRVDVAFTFLGTPRVDPPPPPGASARVTVTMSNLLPVDTSLDARAESSQLTMVYTMQALPRPDRPPEQMVATWMQRIERRLKPLR
jgi:hypothetical protein